jgi:hypothetical protein
MRLNMKRIKSIAVGLALVVVGVLLSSAFFISWVKNYPNGDDPKNIDYVLWKHELNQNMNLDDAVSAMTHDTWAVELVEGKTLEQLHSRFGLIRTLKEARSYDQFCATNGSVGERGVPALGKEVVFLRESDWMVILENGKAVDLVLCKGY